ncbi:hypothetical protein AB0P02_17385 [Streptomyces griseoluteus]|uniref:hypothetical protein n=1 Tax=Streptomyces griseoluteus TaxID=29306 RepID=UPI003429814C
MTHRGVVGVGGAELVLEALEKRPYEAELRTQKGVFGIQQEAARRDGPVGFAGVFPLHGL